jgi:hypothetical protein
MYKILELSDTKIEEVQIQFRKTKKYLLQNIEGFEDDVKKNEFINIFMFQMLIFWNLQKIGFLNNDKNFFLTNFLEIKQKKSSFNSYFEFLIYLLEKTYAHKDRINYNDEFLGNFIIYKPALILKIDSETRKTSLPNISIYTENENQPMNIPLFNLFKNNLNEFNGFIFGGLYENLIIQMKKKISGSYYTPETIASYLCKTTIEHWFLDQVNKEFTNSFKTLDSVIRSSDTKVIKYLNEKLSLVKIMDPAVGTGHFLESAIKVLIEINRKIWRANNDFSCQKSGIIYILLNNVYGVDIDPQVLKIAQTRLFLFIVNQFNLDRAQSIKYSGVSDNLREGNSLLGYTHLPETKQLKLEIFLPNVNHLSVEKSVGIYSEFKENIRDFPNKLALIQKIEEIDSIISKRLFNFQSLKKAILIKNEIFQILKDSLSKNYSMPIQELVNSITNSIKEKLDQQFSQEFGIPLDLLTGVKTLHWVLEFPDIFLKDKRFDIILANPPYLGESGNKEIFRVYAKALQEYYEGKMDLWYLFLHRSLDLMQTNSYSTFITSSYWITASGAMKLRDRIRSDVFLIQYINFNENVVFNNAQGVHTNTLTFKKSMKKNESVECIIFKSTYPVGTDLIEKLPSQKNFVLDQMKLTFQDWDPYFHFLPKKIRLILELMTKNSIKLDNSGFFVKEGIVTGLNKITKKQIKKNNLNNDLNGVGVFILDEENQSDLQVIHSFNKEESNHLKPFYKNSNIRKYRTDIETKKRILYLNRHEISLENLPNIKKHLENFQKPLERSLDNPPYLNRPRTQEIFTSPKIVTPHRSLQNNFAYNSVEWFAAQDVYFILSVEKNYQKLKALHLILNSKLAYFWFFWMGKRKGKQLELFGEPLSFFPIPNELERYQGLSILSEYLSFLHAINELSPEFQRIKNFFQEQISDSLVFEMYFKEDLLNEGFYDTKTLLITKVTDKLIPIDYDQWIKLSDKNNVGIGLTQEEIDHQMILREECLKKIEECYRSIISNSGISELLIQLKELQTIKNIENWENMI